MEKEKPLSIAKGNLGEGFLGNSAQFGGLGKNNAEIGRLVEHYRWSWANKTAS